MTGLDTNVLVRYLVQDDAKQSARATALIEDAVARGQEFLIHPVVLCELVWVLESAYGIGRREVAGTLERILRTAQFEIADKEIVWSAWSDYRAGKADFADYLIGRACEALGAGPTATFDRDLQGHRLFRLL